MTRPSIKVAILTGSDTPATCMSIEAVRRVPGVSIVAIVFDTNPATPKKKFANLKRNIRREGYGYIGYKVFTSIRDFLDASAAGITPRVEVDRTLVDSFPEMSFCLQALSERTGIPIYKVDNLNSSEGAERLRKIGADLGIVLGTRILMRSTFSVPRLGCINLHKGKVPEYRGMPPGFWELYDGASSAGVTVHFVDDGLDTGDILGEDQLGIDPHEHPKTLHNKLDLLGAEVLARAMEDLTLGKAVGRKQSSRGTKARTSPTRAERNQLYRKLGISDPAESWKHVCKTLLYLVVFYSGAWDLVRGLRRLFGNSRASILLYHRVNEQCFDRLTASRRRFAEHMLLLRKHYKVISTPDLVQAMEKGEPLASNSVAIHFDDCYADVYTNAAKILTTVGFPACSFVSSAFVDTDRRFHHDADKYPVRLANLTTKGVRALRRCGLSIGSHTMNHVDMGSCGPQTAEEELAGSKLQLQTMLQEPVVLFSYPFGGREHVTPEVRELARQVGYKAVFSAYGGWVTKKTSLFDIPRFGVSEEFRGLDLLMELEGLSLQSLKQRLFPQRAARKSTYSSEELA